MYISNNKIIMSNFLMNKMIVRHVFATIMMFAAIMINVIDNKEGSTNIIKKYLNRRRENHAQII